MSEFGIAVALFTGIVTLLAVFIVAARSVLVVSGEVIVTVNEDARSLPVTVGRTLLAALSPVS